MASLVGQPLSRYREARATLLPVLLLLLILSAQASGQVQNIAFERLSTEEGLVSPTVYCMFQDSRGFMWFGTDEGLCRYDGIRFKLYDPIPMGPHSTIHEDRHGSLWIISSQIHRFDITSGKIRRYHRGTGSRALHYLGEMDFRAWNILEDASGDIWIGTRGAGLARYLRANDSIVTYTHDPENAASLCNDTVNTICEDKKGILWFGTRRGIDRFDRTTGTFVHCDESRGNRVYTIVEDQEQSLWLGTEDGLCRIDGSRTSFERYRDTNWERDIIRYLFEDSRHDLWVASDSGLARFDRSTNRFMIARASRGDIPIVPSDFTLKPILEDRTGTVWITIDGVGLGMFDREKQAFEVYSPNPRDPHALPENTVTTMFEDRSGTLWIGMLNTGVCRVERARGPFIHIAQNPFDKIQLSNRVVTSILEDSEGTLWVGTSDGLDRLDLTAGTGTHYRADPNDSRSLSHGRILSLAEEAPGKLWVGTSDGLDMLNKATGTFTRFTPDPGKLGNISVIHSAVDLH